MESKSTIQQIIYEEIAVIEKATGGLIKDYEWWVVKGTSESFTTTQEPKDKQDVIYHGALENSFVSQGGVYIGDLDHARWYVKNKLRVVENYPNIVGTLHDSNGSLKAYYGYSHRGGQTFKLGDRLFEEDYIPVKEDYIPEQWQSFIDTYNETLEKYKSEDDEFAVENLVRDGTRGTVPFTMRGSKVIETWPEALQAAVNLGRYLS
jgi:hypothetical protein